MVVINQATVNGLLGDAHDAADGLIVHAHFVEDEEGGVENINNL